MLFRNILAHFKEDIANKTCVRYDVFANRLAGAIILEYSKRNEEWLAKILPKIQCDKYQDETQ
jgi:hypothetical protein